ncbi:MAG: type II toxin-antitoxin system YafQ family toxin [Candidatus Anammoxibacter sp.]
MADTNEMFAIHDTKQYRKDIKRLKKQSAGLARLKDVILLLGAGKELPKTYKDHNLIGNLESRRECHIKTDWLLIYKADKEEKIITLERTGSHSALF